MRSVILIIPLCFLLSAQAVRAQSSSGCTVVWGPEYSDTSSVGATQYTQYSTLDLCQQFCASVTSCVAVDFDTTTSTCWVHTTGTDLLSQYQATGVDQYRVTNRTCPSACTVVWSSVMPDTSAVGANLFTEYTTLSSCQNYCASISTCVAIDFDTTSQSSAGCWVHTNAADLNNLYTLTGVNHYSVVSRSCGQTNCSVQWSDGMAQTLSTGATQYTQYNNVSTCQQFCVSVSTCVAVDFDTSTMSCWVHTNAADLSSTYYSANVTQYKVLSRACTIMGCTGVWGPASTDTVSTGASQFSQYPNLTSCQNFCVSLPNCVAIDFDQSGTSNAGCWVHTNPADLAQQYDAAGVTEYRLVSRSCPSGALVAGCGVVWSTAYPNAVSSGGVRFPEYVTLDECLALCVNIQTCVAVDLDTSVSSTTSGCWVHTNLADLNNQYQSSTASQYRVQSRTCGSGGSPSVAPPTTTVSAIVGDCVSFTAKAGVNSAGAALQAQYTTVAQCESYCASQPTCVAVDFDSASFQCWVHTNPADLATLYHAPTITQYRISRACPECAVWSPYPGLHSANGMGYSTVNTLADCQSVCLDLTAPACVAIDYDSSLTANTSCWVHTNPSDLSTTYAAGPTFSQYRLTYESCASTTNQASGSYVVTYTAVANTQSINGAQFSQYTTVSACENFCTSVPTCVAVDFDTATGCWIHTNLVDITNASYIFPSSTTTQYRATRIFIPATTTPGSGGRASGGASAGSSNDLGVSIGVGVGVGVGVPLLLLALAIMCCCWPGCPCYNKVWGSDRKGSQRKLYEDSTLRSEKVPYIENPMTYHTDTGRPQDYGGVHYNTDTIRSVPKSGLGTTSVRSGLDGERNNYQNERRSAEMGGSTMRGGAPDELNGDVAYDYRTYKNTNYESVS